MNTIGSDVRRRIDAHLDAIDRVLADQGMTRAERRNVTDDVETQILDMLAERTSGEPTVADIDAILAELDPPEAFSDEPVTEAIDQPKRSPSPMSSPKPGPAYFSRLAGVGAIWAALALAVLVVMAGFKMTGPPRLGVPDTVALLLYVVIWVAAAAPIGTTILGLAAISGIRHSNGRVYGLPLAVFDALVFPLLLIDWLIVALCVYGQQSWMTSSRVIIPLTPTNHIFWLGQMRFASLVGVALCIIIDVILIRWAWKAAVRPAPTRAESECPEVQDWLNDGTLSAIFALVGVVLLMVGVILRIDNIARLSLVLEAAAMVAGILTYRTFRGKLGTMLGVVVVLVVVLMHS